MPVNFFFLIRSFTSPILWLIKKTFVNGRILDSKICNYEMLFAHTKSSPQHSFSLACSLWKICKHVLTQRVITREIDMSMKKGRKINERKFQLTSLERVSLKNIQRWMKESRKFLIYDEWNCTNLLTFHLFFKLW